MRATPSSLSRCSEGASFMIMTFTGRSTPSHIRPIKTSSFSPGIKKPVAPALA